MSLGLPPSAAGSPDPAVARSADRAGNWLAWVDEAGGGIGIQADSLVGKHRQDAVGRMSPVR
jgi:hypothetical protein